MKLKLLTTFLLIIFLKTTSFGQTKTWTGATNSNWNTASNWNPSGVPAASDDVVIENTTKKPVINGITANVKNLSIKSGATLSLSDNTSSVLNISGNFVNNGTFTAAGKASVVNFNGANQNVAAATYSNLTLSGSGTKTFGAITTIRNLLAISTNVIANLGAVEHSAGILTLGGAGPLSASWGSTSSNPVAKNTNNTFFASSSGIINITGSAPDSAIDNNYASYTSGASDEVWGSIGENDGKLTLSAPPGSAFINVKFASYGSPTGTAPAFKIGSCHAFNSRTVTTGLLGSNVATVPASGSFNNTFGDPCFGVLKSYNVVATYAQPFCTVGGAVPSFVINGSIPTGGDGGYTYLWEISTTSPTTGYTSVSGTNNEKDYRVSENTITKTTWFRRTVTSGIYTDATIVIVQVVSEVPVKPTTFKSVTDNCKGTATLTVSGGSVGGLGGYAEFYSDACGGTVVGTSNSIPAIIVVSPTVGNTTYYVKYKNSCNVTECLSVVATPPSVSITAAASATPVCYSTANQTTSLAYTATTGTPTKYSITWDAAGKMAELKDQGDTAFAFSETGGTLNTIAVPATVRAGTYTGTLTVKNNSSCVSFKNTFTVTITPSVAINTFSPASSNRCQEAGNFVATTTATNSSGITYSLDSTTKAFSGNSIDASSGAITFAAGWFGTTTITATAAGCNGPKTTTYVITTTANAAVPVANASTAIDCTSVTANWSASANATSYELDLATDIGFANMVAGYPLNVGNVVTKLITGLNPGTKYYYRVHASNGCGTSAGSGVQNATTTGSVITIPVVDNPNNIECNAVTLRWNTVPNATGYQIDIATDIAFTNFVTGFNSYVTGNNSNSKYVSGLPGGILYYRVRATNSCFVTDNSNKISFATNGPGGTISEAQTICSGTTAENLKVTGNFTEIIRWQKSNTILFTNPTNIDVTTTILTGVSLQNLTQNTYFRVEIKGSTNCTRNVGYSAPVLITVSNILPKPVLGTETQPICAKPTGSITLTSLPTSGSVKQTGTEVKDYPYTAASSGVKLIENLAPGTYQFAVSSGTCSTSEKTVDVVINPIVTNTWTNFWSEGTPNANQALIFSGDYSPATVDIIGCSCTVNSGAVTIKTGRTMTITNEVVVNGGSLTFEDQASLVQTANVATNQNIGKINYKRTSKPMKNFDFTYWSSPVVGQTAKDLSPNTFFDKYNKWTNGWVFYDGEMMPGVGYIIRVPKPDSHYLNGKDKWTGMRYSQPVEFIGVPSNGNIDGEAVMAGKNLLIGNPYPSALKADAFIEANKERIDGALYFWTHNTAIKPNNNGSYSYTSDDYAIYSSVGGVATRSAKIAVTEGVDGDGKNGLKPSGNIAAGQSFFAKAKATVTIEDKKIKFTNAMRVDGNNGQFFKMAQSKTAASKSRVWLNFSNDDGAFKQILVGYLQGATDDYESQYDAKSLNGNSFVNFYSLLNNVKFSIQGRALPFSNSDAIPLGYASSVAGDFSIGIDEADGELADKAIYLEDKVKGEMYDLRKGAYTFNTEKGTFNDRFILKYTNNTLGVDDFQNKTQLLMVSVKNKTISIDAKSETLSKVIVYDIAGRTIYNNYKINSSILEISNLRTANQVLLVKVVLESGVVETRKIIVN